MSLCLWHSDLVPLERNEIAPGLEQAARLDVVLPHSGFHLLGKLEAPVPRQRAGAALASPVGTATVSIFTGVFNGQFANPSWQF